MDLLTTLEALSAKASEIGDRLQSEEATKTALVLPFITALGYDVFDPGEVVPEFVADVGIKKGEKVDYAICRHGEPIILIECKPLGAALDGYSSQLYRYFSVTDARIAILTDGVTYRFYSDIESPNRLDDRPFLSAVLGRLREDTVKELDLLSSRNFDIEAVLARAKQLRHIRQIKDQLAKEFASPSAAFTRHFVDPIHKGHMRQSVLDRYEPILKRAIDEYLRELVEGRLRKALQTTQIDAGQIESDQSPAAPEDSSESPEVETTMEELEGFFAVKAILQAEVEPKRIVARDVRSYFGVLLDDNNRKPICRLWFNGKQKYLGVFDEAKCETRIPIAGVDGLFAHCDKIKESLRFALGGHAGVD